MLVIQDLGPETHRVAEKISGQGKELIAGIVPTISECSFGVDEILGEGEQYQEGFFVLRDGAARLEHGSQALLIYEPGDLVGIHRMSGLDGFCVRVDFGVIADYYSWRDFYQAISSFDRFMDWTLYLALKTAFYQSWVGDVVRATEDFTPKILTYEPGQIIIQEGTFGECVYTMLSGEAEVSIKGVVVGDIQADEIFGAMAFLTAGMRTATVKAKSYSTVMEVESADFEKLLCSRPETTRRLLGDMARAIVSGNERLVELRKS